MILHGYFRSAASWRIRIALGLKGLTAEHRFHHLRRGEQRAPDYLALNPQGLVPTLVTDAGDVLIQSLAITEWLDETYPTPPLLPGDATARARIRGFALVLAADTHPLQNLRLLRHLSERGVDEAGVQDWASGANAAGLAACEALLAETSGPFCFGPDPTLADICLVPQLGNARRFGVDVKRFPRLLEREAACQALPPSRPPHRTASRMPNSPAAALHSPGRHRLVAGWHKRCHDHAGLPDPARPPDLGGDLRRAVRQVRPDCRPMRGALLDRGEPRRGRDAQRAALLH